MISSNTHLSEQELDDVLLGDASPAATEHMATCELCRAQLQPFEATVAAFNAGSIAWAQAKSNTISRDLSGATPSGSRLRPFAWAAGVAMIAGIAFSLSASLHFNSAADSTRETAHLSTIQATAALPAPGSAPEMAGNLANDIASDNAMLNDIDSAISTPEPSPLKPFRRTSAHTGPAPHTSSHEVQD